MHVKFLESRLPDTGILAAAAPSTYAGFERGRTLDGRLFRSAISMC